MFNMKIAKSVNKVMKKIEVNINDSNYSIIFKSFQFF